MIAECFYEAMQAISRLNPSRPLPGPVCAVESDQWKLAVNITGDVQTWNNGTCGAEIAPYSVAAVNKEFVAMAMMDAGGGTLGGITEDRFIEEMKAITA